MRLISYGVAFTAAVLFGLASALRPDTALLFAGAILAVVLLNYRRAAVALLLGVWPAFIIGSHAGYVIGGTGLVVLFRLLLSSHALHRAWGRRWLPIAASPFVVLFLAAIASWPLNPEELRRIVLFFAISIPMFFAGGLVPMDSIRWHLIFGAFPLAVWVTWQASAPGNMNEITVGLVMAVASLAAATITVTPQTHERIVRFGRWPLAAFYLVAMLRAGSLGPFVAWCAGVGFCLASTALGTSSTRRKPIAIAVALVLALSVSMGGLYRVYTESRLIPEGGVNTVQARADAWRHTLELKTPFGKGLEALGETAFGARTGFTYPHNFLLDALLTIGMAGLALILYLTLTGLRRAYQSRNRDLAMAVTMVVAAAFSGGLYENWFLWFALGTLLRESNKATPSHTAVTNKRSDRGVGAFAKGRLAGKRLPIAQQFPKMPLYLGTIILPYASSRNQCPSGSSKSRLFPCRLPGRL